MIVRIMKLWNCRFPGRVQGANAFVETRCLVRFKFGRLAVPRF